MNQKNFRYPQWSDRIKGYIMILLSALCYGTYGVWSRLLGSDFGVFYQGWVHSAIILAILLPIALIGKYLKPIKKSDRKWFAITMICTVFTQAPLYFAFIHLPLGMATFIFYGFYLITSYLVGWFFLSEKITAVKIISLFIAFLGLLLAFSLSLSVFSISAMLLAALNGVASGGEIATSKKSTEKYSSFQLSMFSWIFILITHLPLSIMMSERQLLPSFNLVWLAMLGYSVSSLLGSWLVIEGYKYVEASIGGLIGLLEIIFSVLFGIFIFNDYITFTMIISGLIIILAAILPDAYALKHPKASPPPPPFL